MHKTIISAILAAVLALGGFPHAAHALNNRSWVSNTGSDSNACTLAAPCATWNGALAKTSAGGEIDALTAGDFGGVTTIGKAITLDGGAGQVAGVTTSEIVVAAGASDVVIVRNLTVSGAGFSSIGIDYESGKELNVEHCAVASFLNGMMMRTTGIAYLMVRDSSFANNVGVSGGGIVVAPTGGVAYVQLTNVSAAANTFGIVSSSNGGTALVTLTGSTVFGNTTAGVNVTGSAAFLILDQDHIMMNNQGVLIQSGGTAFSYNNNAINANLGNNDIVGGSFNYGTALR
ncbi:MAG: hypothetical protein JO162_13090 [Alphaproteobacteria bacterium]|nr:hypothetical protein [Alphaproteobacteria bacterium]